MKQKVDKVESSKSGTINIQKWFRSSKLQHNDFFHCKVNAPGAHLGSWLCVFILVMHRNVYKAF